MSRFGVSARRSAVAVWVSVAAIVVLAAGCRFPGSVRNVVKIGLVAPFEGPQRNMAYDLLFAARIAVQRHNLEARSSEPLVELIALNDDGRATESRQQAREMAIDPDIVGVVGPWSTDTAQFAMDTYRAAGLAVVLPDVDPAPDGHVGPDQANGMVKIATGQIADRALEEGFRALTGREPSAPAIQAYEGTSLLLATVSRASAANNRPTRADVLALIETAEP